MTALEPTLEPLPATGSKNFPWKRILNLPNLLTLVFLAISIPFIYYHPLWRDEAQAYLIARDSRTPWEMLYNMRYEGHPPLWHFLLWLLTRITLRPEAMQYFHLLLAAASVYLFTRFSPFPWPIKILFPFGYFTLFEYNILARNYQFLLLFSIALCALWQHRRFSFLATSIFLVLLCMSHLLGVILAAAFLLMFLLDALFTRAGRAAIATHYLRFSAFILLTLAGAALALKWMMPAPDYAYDKVDWLLQWKLPLVQKTLLGLWNVYVPIPTTAPRFWENNFLHDSPSLVTYGLALTAAILVCLLHSWRAFLLFMLSAGGAFAFFYMKLQWATALRHQGVAFIALVAAFWIAWVRFTPPARRWWKTGWRWFTGSVLFAFLAVQTFAAVRTLHLLTQYEFVPSKRAAQLIQKNLQPGDFLVSGNQAITSSIAAYLPNQKFYFPNGDRWGTFTLWDHWLWKEASDALILKFAKAQSSRVIIIRCFNHNKIKGALLLGYFPPDAEGLEMFSVQLYDPADQN